MEVIEGDFLHRIKQVAPRCADIGRIHIHRQGFNGLDLTVAQVPEIAGKTFNTAIISEFQGLPRCIRDNCNVLMLFLKATSSTQKWRADCGVFRRASPRLTACCIMLSLALQLSFSCFLTASTVLIFNHEMTNDSNSSVYRLPGTGSVRKPCSGHITRGTSAPTIVENWQVSRWRHLRSR